MPPSFSLTPNRDRNAVGCDLRRGKTYQISLLSLWILILVNRPWSDSLSLTWCSAVPGDCWCHHHLPREHPPTAGPHFAGQNCKWVSHSHPCTTAQSEPFKNNSIYFRKNKEKEKGWFCKNHSLSWNNFIYCTWSPGTLGVMLHGRFVIIPRTVSTDSIGTEKLRKFRAIHRECFQEQYKMMDGGWDCKSISNFVLLIPAKLNHQSSFSKIKRKASSKKWSELKLDKMRNVLWFLEI